jgi:hypothetical protein
VHRCLTLIVWLGLTTYANGAPSREANAETFRAAIEANPADYAAWHAHGEQQLQAGNLIAAKQSYMAVFSADRRRADLLMGKFEAWIDTRRSELTTEEREFVEWVRGRKRFAEATASPND